MDAKEKELTDKVQELKLELANALQWLDTCMDLNSRDQQYVSASERMLLRQSIEQFKSKASNLLK